jgi:hypothetical protein
MRMARPAARVPFAARARIVTSQRNEIQFMKAWQAKHAKR